ncbi:MAG: HlyD family type I secretion periplasmic adaptor subunit [Burkholderiales bacterium]|nr:HlyD family type I secretion periplasmic adaptor subunit [Burkholderiales bacterium]
MDAAARIRGLRADKLDFAPGILRLQEAPPSPLPRLVLWVLVAIVAAALVWAALGRLDIIAVAQGRIVPQSYLQIVQPAEQGIVKELLVREGDAVTAGQVLVRMDARLSEADLRTIQNELALRRLTLRRIDAELAGRPLVAGRDDPPELFVQVDAQYRARRQAYLDALATEQSVLAKAEQDLKGALEVQEKLARMLPLYREQEEAFDKLSREGFAGRLMALEKSRDRIEKEQDLKAQEFAIASLRATIEQAGKRIAQLTSNYRRELQDERVEVEAQYARLRQDADKQSTRRDLLELRAPQDGIVKDLATHTVGSVLAPGTVVMTLVPVNDPMQAEVWVTHDDAGFVAPSQPVKLKLATYPFQKYGMVEGQVKRVSPDASEIGEGKAGRGGEGGAGSGYRTLVSLKTPYLEADGKRYPLSPGMAVTAEINLGTRTVLEYVLSPVQRTLHEAARER